MSRVEIQGIGKHWGKEEALRDISFAVESGEIVAVVGPSGAGKSTLLKIIAGIEPPDEGKILVGGEDVTKKRSWDRQAAMVFESYVLYPQILVRDNIAFPLRAPAVKGEYGEEEIKRRVEEVSKLCEIDHLLDRLPAELSGGQRQRVALSRALVRDATAFLMDEPIAHLDAKLRHWLRAELRRWLANRDVPTLWATPDGIEAMAIADRIAVLVEREIVQIDTPRKIYSEPRNAAVAALLGEPAINLLNGTIDSEGLLRFEGFEDRPQNLNGGAPAAPGSVLLGIRPNKLRLTSATAPGALPAEVVGTEFGSRDGVVIVDLGGQLTRIVTRERILPKYGDSLGVEFGGSPVHLFEADGERDLLSTHELLHEA